MTTGAAGFFDRLSGGAQSLEVGVFFCVCSARRSRAPSSLCADPTGASLPSPRRLAGLGFLARSSTVGDRSARRSRSGSIRSCGKPRNPSFRQLTARLGGRASSFFIQQIWTLPRRSPTACGSMQTLRRPPSLPETDVFCSWASSARRLGRPRASKERIEASGAARRYLSRGADAKSKSMKRDEWLRSGFLIFVLLVLAILVAQSRRNCEIPGSSWVPCVWGEPLKRR